MITDKDITKLEKIFVTKVDLKNELSKYATKNEMEEALDERTDIIVKEVSTVIEMVGHMSEKIEEICNKLDKKTSEHDDILEHHQRQIDNLDDKVFPTT